VADGNEEYESWAQHNSSNKLLGRWLGACRPADRQRGPPWHPTACGLGVRRGLWHFGNKGPSSAAENIAFAVEKALSA
jgi:hypothetical protein